MIEAKDISKTYNPRTRKANTVLDHASISFPDSGFVFIVGRSGTGKSTILNAMGGLISYQGDIFFDKQKVDIDKYRAKNIGYVFQDFLLFDDLSVRENIKISLNIAGVYDENEVSKRTEVLLKAVGLNINSKRKAYALSLGQRQRVAIARTLASNPHIILADEPTGNLDSKNSIVVMDILKKLSVDHLVICVTHNTNLVKLYADKAYAIIDKKFSEIDPSTQKLEEAYASSEQIEIGQMEEKEYQDSNFLVKFYSSSSSDHQQDEIKIIKKGGKILVVGDNVSLASPSQVVEATSKVNPEHKKEELKALDLNFDNSKVEVKKTFKDSLAYSYLSSLLWSKNQMKRSTKLLKLVNVILPMILMIILSSLFLIMDSVKSDSSPAYVSTDNVIGLINDDYLTDKTLTGLDPLTPSKVYKLVYKEDTGLIETYQTNYAYKSNNNQQGTTSQVNLSLLNFTLSDKLQSPIDVNYYETFQLRTSNISDYISIGSLNSSLKSFSNLKDDEIVIDKAFLTNVNYSSIAANQSNVYDKTLIDGNKFGEELVGTYLKLPITKVAGLGTDYISYKIAGISSTGLNTIFASENTNIKLRKLYMSYNTLYNLPDWSDYEIVDFEDIKNNPDYTFSSLTGGEVTIEEGLSDSLNSSKTSMAIVSPSDLNDFYSFFLDNENSHSYSQLLVVNRGCTVSSVSNPNKKIICFVNYKNSSNALFYSRLNYFYNYFQNECNCTSDINIPDNLTLVQGSKPIDGNYSTDKKVFYLPSALYNIIKDYSAVDETTSGVYQSSNIFDPIYTTKENIFLNTQSNSLTVNYPKQYINSDNPYLNLATSGNCFFSKDPAKTISFFKAHPEYRLKAMTYTELYNDFVYPSSFSSVKSLFVSALVVLGIIVLISCLNSVSDVNKGKRDIGVLRCLGKSKASIFWNNMLKQLTEVVVMSFLPCLLTYLILTIFALNGFNFGFFLLFYLGYLLVAFLSQGAPLLIVLSKKPNDIIRTLN